ncbi:MAG: FIG00660817: hypothetical protein [uncultured Nocardioidaceae bacterium]|uniref:Uncharacterized protein n=1 Tax=uncultured Nocardioidaceae bacterium TaxID=253824 RepID=A0A6J4M1K2_9ACTN|nr:MAG: FIG00660817: hypothetical protein [uncultured Nocardioidaceae bacterium]
MSPTGSKQDRGRSTGEREDEGRVPPVSREAVAAWFGGRLPDGWFEDLTVAVDRDEVLVVGRLAAPDAGGDADTAAEAEAGRISRFREETRGERIAIAREAERRYGRKVAWGAEAGGTRVVFTHLSVPVMTRLRLSERQVLDTLIDSGVARSRSEALAWCVKLVGSRADTWLADLRQAMHAVQAVREAGPPA